MKIISFATVIENDYVQMVIAGFLLLPAVYFFLIFNRMLSLLIQTLLCFRKLAHPRIYMTDTFFSKFPKLFEELNKKCAHSECIVNPLALRRVRTCIRPLDSIIHAALSLFVLCLSPVLIIAVVILDAYKGHQEGWPDLKREVRLSGFALVETRTSFILLIKSQINSFSPAAKKRLRKHLSEVFDRSRFSWEKYYQVCTCLYVLDIETEKHEVASCLQFDISDCLKSLDCYNQHNIANKDVLCVLLKNSTVILDGFQQLQLNFRNNGDYGLMKYLVLIGIDENLLFCLMLTGIGLSNTEDYCRTKRMPFFLCHALLERLVAGGLLASFHVVIHNTYAESRSFKNQSICPRESCTIAAEFQVNDAGEIEAITTAGFRHMQDTPIDEVAEYINVGRLYRDDSANEIGSNIV